MKGKEKCELLRSIRQNIAKLNGIDYVPKECEHTECSIGTCPLCDEEANLLMEKLNEKEAAGSPIRIDSESLNFFEFLAKEDTDENEGEEITMGKIVPLEGDVCMISSDEGSDAQK